MVSSRDDDDSDHRDAVHLHVAFLVCRTKFGASDVTQSDDLVVFFSQDKVIEFLHGVHESHGTDGKFDGISLDTAGWEFHVFSVERFFHVGRCDAVSGHLHRVEPKSHGVTFLTPDAHTTYFRDGLELFLDCEVSHFAQFQQRAFVTLERYHQDGLCVCVCF